MIRRRSRRSVVRRVEHVPPSATIHEDGGTRSTLRDWFLVRGNEPGALFTNCDRAGKGDRLTGSGIYRLVRKLGRKVGINARPHGLRHAAITTAAEITGGNLVAVQKFSRHRNVQTVLIYVDNYKDEGGEIAKKLAGRVQL